MLCEPGVSPESVILDGRSDGGPGQNYALRTNARLTQHRCELFGRCELRCEQFGSARPSGSSWTFTNSVCGFGCNDDRAGLPRFRYWDRACTSDYSGPWSSTVDNCGRCFVGI